MFIIRPVGISKTPKKLARLLGIETRISPGRYIPNTNQDFFMTYPENVRNRNNPVYAMLHNFYKKHKAGQRQKIIEMGLPAQPVILNERDLKPDTTYIVRPLRHQQSSDYFKLTSDVIWLRDERYASPIFPKTREYRLIFVLGKLVIFYKKKRPENADYSDSWSGDNASFITIPKNDWPGTALFAHTDCLHRLINCPIINHSHIVAVDVMYSGKMNPRYSILEFNTCPGLTLENSIQSVVETIKEEWRDQWLQ